MIEQKSNYDLPTAITFFLAGLGAGAFLVLMLSPRQQETSGAQIRSRIRMMAPNLKESRAL
jgi:hypothetical protein